MASPTPRIRRARPARPIARLLAVAVTAVAASQARAQYDVSAPAMIQLFESSWTNVQRRAPDLFMAGYGQIWIPPSSRADSGNQSVGYDVYDRFDLGNADSPTLYGTENTLKRSIVETRRAGLSTYADVVWNHNGFSTYADSFFASAGGYPGMVAGDFRSSNVSVDTDPLNGRLSGLYDIAQESNNQLVRNPVPGFANNVPAGTAAQFGRLANVPNAANRRFYQDRNRPADRTINGTPVWDFMPGTLTTGDPVAENAVGYMMRHAQWMVQEVGVDGFRLDATKHFPAWVLDNFFDVAVSGANRRPNLDGSTRQVFSFGENFDTTKPYLQTYINKSTSGNLVHNRDTKDFPLYYAVKDNLSSANNGAANSWFNIVGASLDSQDDGFANNGSQGVGFVQSADSFGPDLSNVAHAYALMRPGNQLVYFNAKAFGNGRDFPKDGRGDALGGLYGEAVTKLTTLRNTHGRGNYIERFVDQHTLVYERDRSAVVALNNFLDTSGATFDNRTVQTNFAPGTRLLEMTGNATDAIVDPTNVVADFVVVDSSGRINFNLPRNKNSSGSVHGKGYLIYGLPTPNGTLSVPDKNRSVAGGTATANTNGTTRLAGMDVVTGNAFTINLQTSTPVIGGYVDTAAGGDNALFSINGGLNANGAANDLNGNGNVDYRSPGSVVYGFEEFTGKKSPLVGGGDGQYTQVVDATKLVEGFNYLEVRAFRARPGNEPPVYSSFKKVIYVDRAKADSSLVSITSAGGNDRAVRVANADGTADNVHVILDTGAALTEAQTLALVNGGTNATQVDAGLWSRTLGNVGNGNHTLSLVAYEPSGNVSVKRLVGISITTGRGRGVGDVNYDGTFSASDTAGLGSFDTFLYSRGAQFNAASDLNADGLVDNRDLFLLPGIYRAANATAALNSANTALVRRGNVNGDSVTTAADIDFLFTRVGLTTGDTWLYDLNVDGVVTRADVDVLVRTLLQTAYGDADLDRRVGFDDLLAVAQNYNAAGTWATGDFNGDLTVGFDDLLALAQNYNFSGLALQEAGGSSNFAADWALAQSLVPEPTTLTCFGVLALARRHRRA